MGKGYNHTCFTHITCCWIVYHIQPRNNIKGGKKKMAKLTAWLVTLVGVLLVLPLLGVSALDNVSAWLIPIAVLLVGLGKLVRNYGLMKAKKR